MRHIDNNISININNISAFYFTTQNIWELIWDRYWNFTTTDNNIIDELKKLDKYIQINVIRNNKNIEMFFDKNSIFRVNFDDFFGHHDMHTSLGHYYITKETYQKLKEEL